MSPGREARLFLLYGTNAFRGICAIFGRKRLTDCGRIHAVYVHNLRGRPVAAHHGDARGVDPEAFCQQGDDGLVGPALFGRCLDLHLERVAEPADDLVSHGSPNKLGRAQQSLGTTSHDELESAALSGFASFITSGTFPRR